MSVITKTTAGLNLLRSARSGADNPKITYVAFGTSNVAPTSSDTQLGGEFFRKKVTSYTNGASNGEIIIGFYLAPADAVGSDVEEVGFFGGNTATSAPNSGILIGRGLYSHNPKTNLESIVFNLDETFS